ncbi:hypothetical protein H112_02464 [Trichophyton rubrum D6]|uniref:Uncharacterized protein n=3 Tax=Trichophyton TaxID=5550 RepID=F2SUS9_TRIRC|nr:uncharacterized protein TERG_06225 [Trichophyton rubrum CBS 118892]EZF25197.1 hypothetical protein H100_02465 [Trichophyton rubrum MR850]EZF44212.1 hypothetical protein H102_02459 [Trichophyton rubrum CBS 100081]EZF54862.1 hypothetical protein H103_02471 [Trichophyton rubrum CBS 288.86]EZF65497.1 hypothetical protein H104_02450 [Trichophyton rubrum CBS 289.86]EZF76112.1 hypothetical protein H105_02479 [Trichophyton soudanense CBS 452.61]EZF86785.1 hypothetical protein H110_02468 [Trichophy
MQELGLHNTLETPPGTVTAKYFRALEQLIFTSLVECMRFAINRQLDGGQPDSDYRAYSMRIALLFAVKARIRNKNMQSARLSSVRGPETLELGSTTSKHPTSSHVSLHIQRYLR